MGGGAHTRPRQHVTHRSLFWHGQKTRSPAERVKVGEPRKCGQRQGEGNAGHRNIKGLKGLYFSKSVHKENYLGFRVYEEKS